MRSRESIRSLLSDRQAIIATLYGECAGESVTGQIAVACVLRNRVHADLNHDGKPDWWGEGFAAVCLAKWQFSCWWEDTPNSARVYELANALMDSGADWPWKQDVAQLGWIADGVLSESVKDITDGATHYLTAALWQSNPPAWSRGKVPCKRIGAHVFFKGID